MFAWFLLIAVKVTVNALAGPTIIVTLSPTNADQEDGDWVIWMSLLAHGIGNKQISTQLMMLQEDFPD